MADEPNSDANTTNVHVYPAPRDSLAKDRAFIMSIWITGQFFLLVILFGMKIIALEPTLESTITQTYVIAFTASWGYWLGTSASSKAKDDTIKEQLAKSPPPAAGGK